MLDNKVKLVVWDLDDTFWQGTLSEEAITPIARNSEIVRKLARRGIVSSICSKNDFETAKAQLKKIGIWSHFVFPQITFAPKGKAIADMIETAGLRAENVLFIDDNTLNLEEVKFFNKGIMALHPNEVLDGLLQHPHCQGKPDPQHTRLKQYKVLERKAEERSATTLSNEEFLRSCNIRISIDADVMGNFDRVLELINRANQLNYTKRRVETPDSIAFFRGKLEEFGMTAGCIRAVDNYGDYGLIGFYLLKNRMRGRKLLQFVFSCRTMNMGIEQFVYEMLERPEIEIVEPVSYGLQNHEKVDWITLTDGGKFAAVDNGDRKLVLVGGCDLLQLASFCSRNRVEFVNAVQNGHMVRYDDPAFICADRKVIAKSNALKKIVTWTHEDAVRFDEAVATAEIVLISMWAATRGAYLKGDRLEIRLRDNEAGDTENEAWFDKTFKVLDLDLGERMKRIVASYEAALKKAPPHATIFVLGSYTLAHLSPVNREARETFNKLSRAFCKKHAKRARFVDIDKIVPLDEMANRAHFTPAGYLAIAKHILGELAPAEPEKLVAAQ